MVRISQRLQETPALRSRLPHESDLARFGFAWDSALGNIRVRKRLPILGRLHERPDPRLSEDPWLPAPWKVRGLFRRRRDYRSWPFKNLTILAGAFELHGAQVRALWDTFGLSYGGCPRLELFCARETKGNHPLTNLIIWQVVSLRASSDVPSAQVNPGTGSLLGNLEPALDFQNPTSTD